jgi:hypothetical protein
VHAAGVLNQEGLWGATKDTAPLAPRIDLPILFADHAGSPFRRKENWGTTRRTSVGGRANVSFGGGPSRPGVECASTSEKRTSRSTLPP